MSDRRMKWLVGMMRATLVKDRLMLARHLFAKSLSQARLSDPGFSRQEHYLCLASAGEAPSMRQKRELALSANERRHSLRVCRFEAADERVLAQHRPGAHRDQKAFKHLRPQIIQFK